MAAVQWFMGMLTGLWDQGADARGRSGRRETVLANQVGVLAAATTFLYEIFYLLYDFDLLWPVFTANVVIITVYLFVPLINRLGRFTLASHVAFANVMVQLLVVTYFLGTGAGAHLFYFTLAGLLALMYARIRAPTTLAMAVVAGALYTLCHFRFTSAQAVLPLPQTVLDVHYVSNVMGAVLLSAVFSFLIRQEIVRAETDLERTNQALKAMTERDGLTGVANRRRLDEHLALECGRARREGRPLSLLMVDVDRFKQFNDQYGHQVGDRCLQEIAGAVSAAARRSADLAARYGGEEFAVVLPETPLDGAMERAEALRAAVEVLGAGTGAPAEMNDVTISVGVACLADDHEPEALIRAADRGLYTAKGAGRNRCATAGDAAAGQGAAGLPDS